MHQAGFPWKKPYVAIFLTKCIRLYMFMNRSNFHSCLTCWSRPPSHLLDDAAPMKTSQSLGASSDRCQRRHMSWRCPHEIYLNYFKPESYNIIWKYHCIFFFGTCLKWCRPFARHAKLCVLTRSSRSVNNHQKSEQKQNMSSRKLTYPTAGKGNHLQTYLGWGYVSSHEGMLWVCVI